MSHHPSPRELARRRMVKAKALFSEAAALAMRGDKTAVQRATSALEAIRRAQADLANLDPTQ